MTVTGGPFKAPFTQSSQAYLRVDAPLQQPPVYFRSDDAAAVEAVERLRAADVGVFKE